ncbi:MAG: retention module-containing protein, partial [Burkholderiales bacterium]|nr:retention module-containing protein [Burkholderiales bacterium]
MASSANIVGKVVALQGQAIVRSADGSQHQLHLGDVIYENDVIVTEANGRVELAFDQGRNYLLREGETVTLDASVYAPAQTEIAAAALLPDAALAANVANAVIGGNSLDKLLEETAAGLGGGDVGDGNGFVQLDRIAEAVTPQSFFGAAATTTTILPIERSAGLLANAIDNASPVITVDAPDNTNDSTPSISGTSNLPAGSTISLLITDSAGAQQTITAIVQPNGTYSATPTRALSDGTYSVLANGKDASGNPATGTDGGSVDTIPPVISVQAPDNTRDNTPTISGSSDLPVGSTITLVVTDNAGTSQTITTTVQTGGIYNAIPALPLADGTYKVVASGRDAAGNQATSTDDGSVDTTATAAPTITITTDSNNDGLISKGELGAATTVAVTVALPGTAKAGDTLTITDGTTPQSHVLTAAEITAGSYST